MYFYPFRFVIFPMARARARPRPIGTITMAARPASLLFSLRNKMDTQQPPTQVTTTDNTPGTNVIVPPQLPMMQQPDAPPIISGDLPPNNDVILTYTMRDVLNGRGQGVQRHPGNVKYRTLVFVNKVSPF